jgi:hypothetical protein
MNKVHVKKKLSRKAFYSKVMTRNLFFCKEWVASFLVEHKGKNIFFSNACSQGQDLIVKNERKIIIFCLGFLS